MANLFSDDDARIMVRPSDRRSDNFARVDKQAYAASTRRAIAGFTSAKVRTGNQTPPKPVVHRIVDR